MSAPDWMKEGWRSGNLKYTDLTISTPTKDFEVHKVIVCSQSDFFDAPFKYGFMEAASNKITVEEDSKIIYSLLEYLYTGEYTAAAIPPAKDATFEARKAHSLDAMRAAVSEVKVITCADKYCIGPLKAMALEHFKHALDNIRSITYLSEVVIDVYANDPISEVQELLLANFYNFRCYLTSQLPNHLNLFSNIVERAPKSWHDYAVYSSTRAVNPCQRCLEETEIELTSGWRHTTHTCRECKTVKITRIIERPS